MSFTPEPGFDSTRTKLHTNEPLQDIRIRQSGLKSSLTFHLEAKTGLPITRDNSGIGGRTEVLIGTLRVAVGPVFDPGAGHRGVFDATFYDDPSAADSTLVSPAAPRQSVGMRDLVITQNITLDGVVSNDSSWFGPATPGVDLDDLNAALMAQADASDALLVGRTTFEEMRGFWPQQVDDATGVTDHLNRVAKYVVSSTLEDPDWDGTTILRGPLEDDVRALKAAPGTDIVVTGSVQLCHALIDAGLVDEYRLFTYPHVEGRGRRLFEDRTSVPALRTAEVLAFRSGIVLTRYRADTAAATR